MAGWKGLICSVKGMGSEIKRPGVISVGECKGSRHGTKACGQKSKGWDQRSKGWESAKDLNKA